MFLRFLGVINAAIWFGGAFFFTLIAAPAFVSPEILKFLPRSHSSGVALVLADRFYTLQYVCGGVALGHLLVESLYAAKPLRRGVFYLAVALLGLALLGGVWLQPKIRDRHIDTFSANSPPAKREEGRRFYRFWSGTAHTLNIISCLGLIAYIWQATASPAPPRYSSSAKLRG